MLTPLQIGRLNLMCSQGGLPSLTTTGMYTWEMTSPVLLPYASYFESMQGTASTLHFSDYQGQAHEIACSKDGQQGDALETVCFAVTTFPRLAECLHVMVFAPGPPSATMSSSLQHLQKVLLLLLSSNRYSSRTLILTSMCPSSTASFRVIKSTTTIMHVLLGSGGQFSASMSVRHRCWHLHDGATFRRGTHWQ